MIICKYEFDRPDFLQAEYSAREVDFYAWTLTLHGDVPSHRLSIRKNIKSGEFEAYRHYNQPRIVALTDMAGRPTPLTVPINEEVIFTGSLDGAVAVANGETFKYHQAEKTDQLCRHRPPVQSPTCPVRLKNAQCPGCISFNSECRIDSQEYDKPCPYYSPE